MSIERIYEQLTNLTQAVDRLEQEVAAREAEDQRQQKVPRKVAAAPAAAPLTIPLANPQGQIDMFGEWTGGNGRAANVNAASALAKKLDHAIENVQWLLKQGRA